MLYLPPSRSTPALVGFGIVTAAWGVMVCLLAHLFVIASPWWLVAACAWGVVLVGITVWNVLWLEKPYDLYNRLIGRFIVRPLRWWILAVTFMMTVLANRPFAGRVRDRGEGRGSTWREKVIQDLMGGSGSSDVTIDESREGRWLGTWVAWIRKTGNGWMLALIPFMLVLGIFDAGGGKPKVSKDTYTLY
jgi:hypothetical protein